MEEYDKLILNLKLEIFKRMKELGRLNEIYVELTNF
jgi:hypothetical protein